MVVVAEEAEGKFRPLQLAVTAAVVVEAAAWVLFQRTEEEEEEEGAGEEERSLEGAEAAVAAAVPVRQVVPTARAEAAVEATLQLQHRTGCYYCCCEC